MLSRSIMQDSWSPKKLACSQPLQYFQNGRQKDNTKEHVQKESPLTSCVLFQVRLPGPIFIRKICLRFCTCRVIFSLRGRRSKFEKPLTYESENICTWGLAGSVPKISVFPTGLEILPYEHFIPVTGMNGGMNSGGPDGIVLHCLLCFPHHKHPI